MQISQHLPKMAAVMDRASIVRSLYHTIPSHGPASVFMTTGNKPTPALQYPALGSLAMTNEPMEVGRASPMAESLIATSAGLLFVGLAMAVLAARWT